MALLHEYNDGPNVDVNIYQLRLKQVFNKDYEIKTINDALSEIVFEEPVDEPVHLPDDHFEGL